MLEDEKSHYIVRVLRNVVLPLVITIMPLPALATTDQADLSVGMKTLPMLTTKIVGTATLAIVFDPINPASKEEAAGIKAVLDHGFEVPGDVKLTTILVSVANLGGVAGSKIAILTSGLSSYYGTVAKAAAGSGILTMSTDLGCVRANKCVLGIVSKPHVEIYYSKAAADSANVTFGQVFTMLAKQI